MCVNIDDRLRRPADLQLRAKQTTTTIIKTYMFVLTTKTNKQTNKHLNNEDMKRADLRGGRNSGGATCLTLLV